MPNRIIREGMLTSRSVSSLSETAQLFYSRLMLIVDDFGRFEADLDVMRARLFPLALDIWPISRLSETLEELGKCPASDGFPLVLVYEVDGHKYLEIHKFNQQIRSKKSKCPEPSARQALRARVATDSTCAADAQHMHTKTNPNPKTETHPKPQLVSALPVTDLGEIADRMYERHPKKKDFPLVIVALSSAVEAGASADLIEERHRLWCETEDWKKENGRFCPKLPEWISDRGYTVKPRDSPDYRQSHYVKADIPKDELDAR